MSWDAIARRLGASLVFFCFTSVFAAETVYRVVYSDDPILENDPALVEKVYGAKIHVIPPEGTPPRHPVKLDGIVIQVDPEYDPDWVMGTRNPMLEYREWQRRLQKTLGLGDIDEKWDEYRFLQEMAPEVKPPEMHLGSEYDPASLDEVSRAEISKRVKDMLAKRGLADKTLEEGLLRMEAVRKLVNAQMGKSIFKVRDFNHSEGKLPKTNKDWAAIYLDYYQTSRPKVKALEKEVEGTSRSLEHEVVDLPHIEGRALDVLLEDPSRTIVQKMVKLRTEMRMHIVEGKVVEGASSLRFYPLGAYLEKEEIVRVEKEIREQFLAPIAKRLGKISCTPDVIVEEETGKVRILDMNANMQSGYYYPDEGVFTPNLFAAALSGQKTSLLEEWGTVLAGRMEGDLSKRIAEFHKRYVPILTDYNAESFWDKVIIRYVEELKLKPTSERYALALDQFHRIGLKSSVIYFQFVSEVQARWPKLRLPDGYAQGWIEHFNSLNKDYRFKVNGDGLIEGEEVKDLSLLFRPEPNTLGLAG